jgi:demethylmenaquinone methyltransferase/2-methoxy-6-polyprenyl-1,4-benzoquinol methylase
VTLVSCAFRSAEAARKCRGYFVDAIRLFYSTDELSKLLRELGYDNVAGQSVLGGTVGFHKARKAA